MMVNRCLSPESLAEIATLSPKDPRRRHLDECPRCGTLARRYRDFLDPAPLPPEADAEAASRILRQRLSTALPELAPALEADDRNQTTTPRARNRFVRPLMAVAAVLVCGVGLLGIRNQLTQPGGDGPPQRSVIRGNDLSPTALDLVVQETGLDLAWNQPADTDASETVFFDSNLTQIERLDSGTAGHFHLADLPAGTRYVRIEFLQAGDVVASTRTLPLTASP